MRVPAPFLLLSLLATLSACAHPGGAVASPAPAELPVAEPPVAEPPGAGGLDAAAMDGRTPVPLTPMMAEHQKLQMRGHLEAVSAVVRGLGREDWAAVEAAGQQLGSSPSNTMMCQHMGAGAPGFPALGLGFHATADGFAQAAQAGDRAAVVQALGDTLAACTSCHAQFRQEIVSEAEYARLTGAPPPNHSGP